MTTDEKSPAKPAKKPDPNFVTINVRPETATEVRDQAEARGMMVGALADRLVQYGLANLRPTDEMDLFTD